MTYRNITRSTRRLAIAAWLGATLLPWASPALAGDGSPRDARRYSEPRQPCASYHPQRSAFFGELHTHTSLSWDARVGGSVHTPRDAYAYALGEPLYLGDGGKDTAKARKTQIDRPLDFAAVTDHAEMFGEMRLCTEPGSPAYGGRACRTYRGDADKAGLLAQMSVFWGLLTDSEPARDPAICGEAGQRCLAASRGVWRDIQAAAEAYYDRSANCEFTTFIGYEYSGMPEFSNLHRNVIFRNAQVPERAISYVEEPRPQGLWRALRDECLEGDTGCDAIAIPHNPNLSNGRMFRVEYPGADTVAEQAAQAALRARVEPLVEVFQHKGDSECRNGFAQILGAPDEFCSFEKFRPVEQPVAQCGDEAGTQAMGNGEGDCSSYLDYTRHALIEGLREADRIGVNPYKFGLMASQDTHNANPGAVMESAYVGAMNLEDTPRALVGPVPLPATGNKPARYNPGGLVGVWAEENSRDALFDAMRRREVFGTSGPRIEPRFFAGWKLERGLCDDPQRVDKAYQQGVAMGGDLPPRPAGAGSPRFMVAAQADMERGDYAVALQRLQVIKGWVDAEGRLRQAVYDVAGGDNGASVDTASCETRGDGLKQACGVWEDPGFEPGQRAVYYARVIENPSCRYNTYICNSLAPAERPASCSDPAVERTVQERAWTSPIWYSPAS